jgi:hypothetical protein
MDVTPTLNSVTYAIDASGDHLSCHHGKRSTSLDTSEDRKFETMEEMFFDANGYVVSDVFAEESDEQFWILLLHSGHGTVRLYYGGRSHGDRSAELAWSAGKRSKFQNDGSVPFYLFIYLFIYLFTFRKANYWLTLYECNSGTYSQINRL